MKHGLDGMLLEVASDDDEMTPLSSPLQSVRRSSQRGNSQGILCSDIIDEDTSEASIPDLPTTCEDQVPQSLLNPSPSTKTLEGDVEEEGEIRLDEEKEENTRRGRIEEEEEEENDANYEEDEKFREQKEHVKEENKSDKLSEVKDEIMPRFFVMKSFSQYDIDVSMERNIWATQPHNERKLNDAFDVFIYVFLLIFSFGFYSFLFIEWICSDFVFLCERIWKIPRMRENVI